MRVSFVWLCTGAALACAAGEAPDRELLDFSGSGASAGSSHSDGSADAGILPPEPRPRPDPPMPTPVPPSPTNAPGTPTPTTTAPPPSTSQPPLTVQPSDPPMPSPSPAPSPTGGPDPAPTPIPKPIPDPPGPDPPSPSPPLPPTPVPTKPDPGNGKPAPIPSPTTLLPDSPSPPPFGSKPTTSPPLIPTTLAPSPPQDTESPSPPPRPQTSPPNPTNPTSTQPAKPSTQAPGADGENRESSKPSDSQTPSSPSSPSVPSSPTSPSSPSSPSETETTPTPTPRRYQRGDDVIIVSKNDNGTDVAVEVVVAPSQSPAIVVRDIDKGSGSSGAPTGSGSDTHDSVYSFLQYLSSSLAFASLFLLIGFHFVAPEGPVSESVAAALSSPNQWELLAFITYIQAMASSALYVVSAAPTYYWRFLDAFSWTVFLPFHFSGSGISYSTTLGKDRRLTEVVILDGLIAFADRIGVNEEDLLQTSVAGFLVVCGALLLVGLGTVYFVRVHKDDDFESEDTDEQQPPDCSRVQSASHEFHQSTQQTAYPLLVVIGLIVIFAAFAFYPLIVVATFEISSQIRASKVSGGSLTIALLALFFVCVAFVARALAAMASARDTKESYRNGRRYRIVWGSLCTSDCINYESRVIFVILWLVMQVISAVVIGCVRSEQLQLALLISVDVVFVASLMVFRPFNYSSKAAILVICGVAVVKAVNTALAFAFLTTSSSSSSHRRAVATAFIVLNSTLIILWFVRLVGLAYHVTRSAWGGSASSRKNPNALLDSGRSSTPDSTRHQSTQYVAITPAERAGGALAAA